MNIQGLNIAQAIHDLDGRVLVLEKYIEYIMQHNDRLNFPSPQQGQTFVDEANAELQKKYATLIR